jgi:putative aldouronate transport system substrate-binding protein
MFDYTATIDGNNLVTYGIKDKDYTITADGTITQTDEGKKKGYAQGTTGQWIPGFYNMYLRADFPGAPEAVKMSYRKMIDHIMENSAPDPTYGLGTTPTAIEKMTDWDKKLKDQVTNVIIGQQSLTDWDKFVASYKSDPVFQKHLKELNEFYSAKSKK